jgi:hypothetical protein
LTPRRKRPLLEQEGLDRRARLIERRALKPLLILAEEDRRILVGRRHHFRADVLFDDSRRLELTCGRVLLEQRVFDEFLDRDASRFVKGLTELDRAEVGGWLLHRLLIDLGQSDRRRADYRDDLVR